MQKTRGDSKSPGLVHVSPAKIIFVAYLRGHSQSPLCRGQSRHIAS